MELLLGMILLLQVLILIQSMQAGKQVLQRIETLETNLTKMEKQSDDGCVEEKGVKKESPSPDDEKRDMEPDSTRKQKEKESQEALLNEVLSEVFS